MIGDDEVGRVSDLRGGRLLVVAFLLGGPLAPAAAAAPETAPPATAAPASPSREALSTQWGENRFIGRLKPGYHFNDKAPNKVVMAGKKITTGAVSGTAISPTSIHEREIVFAGLPSPGEATLYVCDDAQTFCDIHRIPFGGGNDKDPKTKEDPFPLSSQPGAHAARNGTWLTRYDEALKQARLHHQLLMIEFFARWCPGCIRLDTEVLQQPAFAELTRKMTRLRLDVDRFENSGLVGKYNAKAIPTLLVLNSEEAEIDRLTDFQPLEVITRWVQTLAKDPTPIAGLQQNPLLLGRRLLAAHRPMEALEQLKKVSPPAWELPQAEIETAELIVELDPNATEKKELLAGKLRQAVQQESASYRSLEWRKRLLQLQKVPSPDREKTFTDARDLADRLLKDEESLKTALMSENVGEFINFEKLLVATERAEIFEIAGRDDAEIQKAWELAAKIGEKVDLQCRGPSHRYLLVLMQAHLWSQAEELVGKLLANNPDDPELERRRLKILFEQKKFDEAAQLGEKCLRNSYGRNEVWVAENLAKTYIAAKKKKEARALIDRFLGRSDIDWKRTKGSRENLEKLREQVL
ncbi:MAG: hypothetical protein C5B49_14945 [Bdellovibrio sp.]|nr:MAG: hypothetical protein C5B49_14945 [Bdellovibrio sp.]